MASFFSRMFGIGGSKKEESSISSPSQNHSRPNSQIISSNSNSHTQRDIQQDELADPRGARSSSDRTGQNGGPPRRGNRKPSAGAPNQHYYPDNYPDPMKTTPLASRSRQSKNFY